MMENISKIVNYFEIIVFLHDIGKISSHFIMSKDPELNIKDRHAMLILEEKLPDNLNKFLKAPINKIFEELNYLDNGISPIHFICSHHGCDRCIYNEDCIKYEKNFYIKLLQISDRLDSSNPPNSKKQPFYETYLSNFFLIEKKIDYTKIDLIRKKFLDLLDSSFYNFNRENFFKLSKFFMDKTISETRRGANDVSLFTHSKAVSSIFKAILFEYLYFNSEPPKNIFDVELKFLKTKKGYKKLIEEKIGFGNLIFDVEDNEYYLISKYIDRTFLKINNIKGNIVEKIEIEETDKNYLYPLNPENLLSTMLVKNPYDMNFNFSNLVDKTKKIINFARYNEIEELNSKIKGIKKHINNLKKGGKTEEIKIKKNILKKLMRREYYLKRKYEDSFNVKEIENFLMKSLAPIRPPSIVNFSKYLNEIMEKKKYNINELTFETFLKKPLTYSRIIQYCIDIKKIKNIDLIPKFYGKVKFTNKKVIPKYQSIEDIKFLEDKIIINMDKKNIVIPAYYNGEYLDKLNLYFIGKLERRGKYIYPLRNGKSLIHITKLKKGDRIKFII
ncbi:MAG TPA: hypothetical protein PLW79_02350 [Caldisericia bacterium]|nr:hypothetical protein [Caldisericia bacterium]HOL82463.1 hypothetical protein [Caldisericia bacterium]HPP43402.1 hypothetical protein [Caldisericia bacterium]